MYLYRKLDNPQFTRLALIVVLVKKNENCSFVPGNGGKVRDEAFLKKTKPPDKSIHSPHKSYSDSISTQFQRHFNADIIWFQLIPLRLQEMHILKPSWLAHTGMLLLNSEC